MNRREWNCGQNTVSYVIWLCGKRVGMKKNKTRIFLSFLDIKHRSTEHNSSLMMSESEFDSEQDAIFSYERPDRARNRVNGSMTNGEAYSLRPVEG